MSFVVRIALILVLSVLGAQIAISQGVVPYQGQVPYPVTGGTTPRSDKDRWIDHGLNVKDFGVDCTGATNSTAAFRALAAQADWNKSLKIVIPVSCNVVLSSTITFTDTSGVTISGEAFAGDGTGTPPKITWMGTNGGSACDTDYAACVYVFDFEHSDHPVVENLLFYAPGGSNCPDGFLLFDGNPGTHEIGTNGRIRGNTFSNGNCNNPNFIGVNLSPVATNNQENYVVEDNVIGCGQSLANIYSRIGSTNGTAAITATDAPFSAGDVGKRIRLAAAGGTPGPGNFVTRYADTTIASYVSPTQVTISAPAWVSTKKYKLGDVVTGSNGTIYVSGSFNTNADPVTVNPDAGIWVVMWTTSNLQVVVGTSYGVGYRNGASQNAIQQQFLHLQYSRCAMGIQVQGGNVEIRQPSGGQSDIGIYVGGFVAQNMVIDYYASESDFVAIQLDPARVSPITISNSRFSNGNQLASGHVILQGQVFFYSNLFNFNPPSNGVLMNTGQKNGAFVVSVNNSYPATFDTAGFPAFMCRNDCGGAAGQSNHGYASLFDVFGGDTGPHQNIRLDQVATIQHNFFYSAAGYPLPTCTDTTRGMKAVVEDATAPVTYLGAYTSGGSVVAPVFCNGTSWLTD